MTDLANCDTNQATLVPTTTLDPTLVNEGLQNVSVGGAVPVLGSLAGPGIRISGVVGPMNGDDDSRFYRVPLSGTTQVSFELNVSNIERFDLRFFDPITQAPFGTVCTPGADGETITAAMCMPTFATGTREIIVEVDPFFNRIDGFPPP